MRRAPLALALRIEPINPPDHPAEIRLVGVAHVLQLMAIMMVVMSVIASVTARRAVAREDAACRAKPR